MLPINSSNVIGNLAPRVFIEAHRDEAPPVDKQTALEGIKVSLSEQAQKISAAAKSTDDIDKSSLPDNIKQALKMLRELKQQLAEKQAELQALMADQSLSEEERMQQAQGIQSEISSLNGAISTVNGNLIQAIKDAGLSPDQLTELSGLMV
jgi:Sec-independent protein translocase protein TatA